MKTLINAMAENTLVKFGTNAPFPFPLSGYSNKKGEKRRSDEF